MLAETIRTNYRAEAACELESEIIINDPEKETHLYRIAQEAVSNALRHGRAKHVSITLRRVSETECALQIVDNGAGMKKAETRASEGVGLRVMQYRANLIGGEIQVTSRGRGGVTVVCRFPCLCATVSKGAAQG